jgi:hypothetical protein
MFDHINPSDPSICYATVLSRANSTERIDGRPYSPEDYAANADLYRNIFAEQVILRQQFCN